MIHCYKLHGRNIVLDVASGSVHSVDDVVYDVIGLLNSQSSFSTLYAQMKEMHPNVPQKDIQAILADLKDLINRGKLFTPDTFESITTPANSTDVKVQGKTQLKALCLNVSHSCNMICAYCFIGGVVDGIGTPRAHMTIETGKQAIDFLVENSALMETLDIDFFGGEPLLNWQTVKEIVAYAREIERITNKKFRFTLTTNGLLIDDDVIAFTNKEFHNVVLSLDGRREVHNAMRKLPGGGSNYDEVLPKIAKLVEMRREKGYYIRGTFTRENIDFVNDILHLADLGFREISFEPVVAKRGSFLAFTKDDLPELLNQYDMLAIEMKRRRVLGKEFNFYHYSIDLKGGPCIHKRIAGCGVATQYLAVTPHGELYPCHQFIGDTDFLMGDVWRGIVNQNTCAQFTASNIYSRSECRDCWARFYCSGGCAANAYYSSGSIDGTYAFGCELFKKRIEYAIWLKFG